MAFLQLESLLVTAYPTQESTHMARDDSHSVSLDDPPSRRTIIVAFCIGFAFLLALAQGYRAGRMAGRKSSAQFSDILVFAQGFVSISFVFAIGINSAGLGLQTDAQCHAAIRICIAMYGAAKITLYLFLLERVHVLRAPFVDRLRDSVWVIGVILTVGGYAGIMGFQFMSPRADLSRVDGVCRIGIQPDAGLAIITLDTTINLALTVIFVWQLQPTLGNSILPWSSKRDPRGRAPWRLFGARNNNQEVSSASLASHRSVRAMLMRNVIGTSLLLCATIGNNVVFLTWPMAVYSHVCQLTCLADIVLSMLVTNWLTMRSTSATSKVTTQTGSTSGMTSTLTRRPTHEFGNCLEDPDTFLAKPAPTTKIS